LLDRIGPELEATARRDLSADGAWPEVRYLADMLGFMTNQGWRPSPRHGLQLCQLWEHLAAHAPDKLERRRLLIAALATTEDFADVQRIRRQLEDLEKKE
jgi:hypothetical protein